MQLPHLVQNQWRMLPGWEVPNRQHHLQTQLWMLRRLLHREDTTLCQEEVPTTLGDIIKLWKRAKQFNASLKLDAKASLSPSTQASINTVPQDIWQIKHHNLRAHQTMKIVA